MTEQTYQDLPESTKSKFICPVCGMRLIEYPIYKVVRTYNSKIVGKHWFCPNMNCSFESDDGTSLGVVSEDNNDT